MSDETDKNDNYDTNISSSDDDEKNHNDSDESVVITQNTIHSDTRTQKNANTWGENHNEIVYRFTPDIIHSKLNDMRSIVEKYERHYCKTSCSATYRHCNALLMKILLLVDYSEMYLDNRKYRDDKTRYDKLIASEIYLVHLILTQGLGVSDIKKALRNHTDIDSDTLKRDTETLYQWMYDLYRMVQSYAREYPELLELLERLKVSEDIASELDSLDKQIHVFSRVLQKIR